MTMGRGTDAGESITFMAPGRCCVAYRQSAKISLRTGFCVDAIGLRAAKIATAAAAKPVARTKTHRPKGLVQALRHKPLGRLWAYVPAAIWIDRAFNAACATFFARKTLTAHGMKMKSPAPVFRAHSI